MEKNENNIIIYQDENGITKVGVRFTDENVWITQKQSAEIYDTTQENVSMHIANIFKDEELEQNRTNKKFLLVQTEGERQVKRNIDHYNLDISRINKLLTRLSRNLKYIANERWNN